MVMLLCPLTQKLAVVASLSGYFVLKGDGMPAGGGGLTRMYLHRPPGLRSLSPRARDIHFIGLPTTLNRADFAVCREL